MSYGTMWRAFLPDADRWAQSNRFLKTECLEDCISLNSEILRDFERSWQLTGRHSGRSRLERVITHFEKLIALQEEQLGKEVE